MLEANKPKPFNDINLYPLSNYNLPAAAQETIYSIYLPNLNYLNSVNPVYPPTIDYHSGLSTLLGKNEIKLKPENDFKSLQQSLKKHEEQERETGDDNEIDSELKNK